MAAVGTTFNVLSYDAVWLTQMTMKVYLSWNDPVDRKLAVARQKVSTLVELLNLLMVVDLFVGVVNENIILDNNKNNFYKRHFL